MQKKIIVTYRGITDTLVGHAHRLGLSCDRVYGRYRRKGLATRKARDYVFSTDNIRHRHRIVFTYRGVTDTLAGHAKRLGVNRNTVHNRYRALGIATEAAKDRVFSPEPFVPKNSIRITYKGVTRTCMEWSRLTGLTPNTIRYRIRRGELAPDRIGEIFRPSRERTVGVKVYAYRGERHGLTAWARILGFSRKAAEKRLRVGATVRQAFQKDNWQRRHHSIRVEAKGNHTRRKLAALGIFA